MFAEFCRFSFARFPRKVARFRVRLHIRRHPPTSAPHAARPATIIAAINRHYKLMKIGSADIKKSPLMELACWAAVSHRRLVKYLLIDVFISVHFPFNYFLLHGFFSPLLAVSHRFANPNTLMPRMGGRSSFLITTRVIRKYV